MNRNATGALVGALAAVGAWVAWSSRAPEAPTGALGLAAAPTAMPTEGRPPVRPDVVAASPRAASVPLPVVAPARLAAPVLRDGQVMEHGLPTAIRAPTTDEPPAAAPEVALPPGVHAEDAAVNAAGMVALARSPAGNDAAPARPVTATQAP